MGVLAPGSAHALPSAQPPINTSAMFSAYVSDFWAKICIFMFLGFFEKTEKFLESTEITRKLILDSCVDGGLSRGSSMRRPGSEDPHQRQQKLNYWPEQLACAVTKLSVRY